VSITTELELVKLKIIGKIVADCLREMSRALQPGMSTFELDEIGRAFLEKHGARSAPKAVYKFPGTTCISLNHEVAHGIPSKTKIIQMGDLINIDVSAEKDGFFGDTGGSFIVGEGTLELQKLCAATKRALDTAVKSVRAGLPLNTIGKAVESVAKEEGFTIIRNLGSHGVGKSLHEAPEFIAGYYDPNDKRILEENMVITIEPFLSTGATWVEQDADGWTLKTAKKFFSAQYEHSLVITKDEAIILTA